MIASFSTSASATTGWFKWGGLKVHGAVAVDYQLYFLGDTWVDGQGWRLQNWDNYHPGNGYAYVQAAAGTSLAVGVDANLYLVAADDSVWSSPSNPFSPGWVGRSPTACEGGTIQIGQLPTHHNIAQGNAIYVVTALGSIRSWNVGSACWQAMPALPSGIATDVSIYSDFNPWVVNGNGTIYRWTGSAWFALTGLSPGLNDNNLAIGAGSRSLWQWNGSSFSQTDWSNGTIMQLGSIELPTWRAPTRVLVTNDNSMWTFGGVY